MRSSRWPIALVWLCALCAHAAGPRWVAGAQWQNSGQIMNWYRPDVQYFVDAGPLSAYVDHAAAVALVDAAAAVWNVPAVAFTLKNGGALAEDVSSTTVYLGGTGPVWPADVQSANYTAKQIAVVLDADGTLTDMLLGSGASDPSNCRQNAVTQSVDLFIQPGKIAHAVVLLNGRCTGPAAAQQTQMQYQLMRTLGRVIGLGWSQANDNVFTYATAPTTAQVQHWPVMHPIDILCGAYTYQCMSSPFTLRDDDVASLRLVYAAGTNNANTVSVWGSMAFPTGQGMEGVNVIARRGYNWSGYVDTFDDVTGVTGYGTSDDAGNVVTGASADLQGLHGTQYGGGDFMLYGIPALTQYSYTNLTLKTEPVNPLYTGAYAVGPYRSSHVDPSGSSQTWQVNGLWPGYGGYLGWYRVKDAAVDCNTTADGTEAAPARVPAGGVWSGVLCAAGHAAWTGFDVKAGRTATLEATATDEVFVASNAKARPLIGVWHGSDAMGVLPTIAATSSAQNTIHTGLTQLRVSFITTETVRFAVTDARGDGRPDFTYRARLLYADTVMPTRLPAGGGVVRILGTGFLPGMTVTVGGVLAQVTSLTPTEIDAIAPTAAALGGAAVNDVVVTDVGTGGVASISGGLTYRGASTDVLSIALTPLPSVATGVPMPFALKVVDASGMAVANESVTVTVGGAGAVLNACQLASCTLVTDAAGIARTSGTAATLGTVALQASIRSGSSVAASWAVTAVANAVGLMRPTQYVASGAGAVFHPAVLALTSGTAVVGQAVAWSTVSPRVGLASAAGPTGAGGWASVLATGSLQDNEVTTVRGCVWTVVCATETVVAVPAAVLAVAAASGDGQSVASSGSLAPVTVRVADAAGHPVSGAPVVVYQVVTGWQAACPVTGRCPTAPMYGSASAPAMTDDDGMVQVTPMQYANTAAVTTITVTAGTVGVMTVRLQKTP